ncbi:hypothetical protein [Novosphingobium sp. Gsoil 351]|uniref:hypothetical protein n=1 Tax=Novosphingobium sp. Gsoil 351 TaxID=2675225 RepID=UPI0012B4AD6C|nr:hypothetical protein [Novosphingobium sp. Gsoil 351]QGN55201.1 hypothetical protein GKE62_12265 [Novosphingobium sp. Gsoil 351]
MMGHDRCDGHQNGDCGAVKRANAIDCGGIIDGGTGVAIAKGVKQLLVNGAPVIEQSHEFVIEKKKTNAPNR